MTIYVDGIVTHGTGGNGDDTVPPGISGLDWAHAVSDANALELTTFLTLNVLTIGQLATNVRTPLLGSLMTYVGLDATMLAAAIVAGAVDKSADPRYLKKNCFDSTNWRSTYEP